MINLKNVSTVLIFCLFLLLCSCKEYKRNKSNADIPISSIRRGEVLAARHCQSCHLFPDPALLDASSWNDGVLPVMGPHLGLFEFYFRPYPSAKKDKFLPPDFYPLKPLLEENEWADLINYYIATSPDSMPPQQRKEILKTGLSLFQVQELPINYATPAVSFIKIDSSLVPQSLIVCDANQNIFRFNNQLVMTDSLHSPGPIVDIDFTQQPMLACNIGYMNPNNGKFGEAQTLQINSLGNMQIDTNALFTALARPLQISPADLNGDGRVDYTVCEFGNLMGAFSWMENRGNNKFDRHVLRATPGATKADRKSTRLNSSHQ